MSDEEVLRRFVRNPADVEAQLAAGTLLLQRGDGVGALKVFHHAGGATGRQAAELALLSVTAADMAGDIDAAAAAVALTLEIGERDQKAWAHLYEAVRLGLEGKEEIARQLIYHAAWAGIPSLAFVEAAANNFYPDSLPLDWLAGRFPATFSRPETVARMRPLFYATYQLFSISGARASQRDPLFGPASDGLQPHQEAWMTAVLDHHSCVEAPVPEWASVYAGRTVATRRGTKVLGVMRLMQAKPSADGGFLPQPSEIEQSRRETALAAGLDYVGLDLNEVLPQGTPGSFGKGRPWQAEFERSFDVERPALVVWEGETTPDRIGPGFRAALLDWKARFGFKLLVFIPDAHEAHRNLMGAWDGVADLFEVDVQSSYFMDLAARTPAIPAFGHPLAPTTAAPERDLDLIYIGSPRRGRAVIVRALANEANSSVTPDTLSPVPISMDAYVSLLLRAKLTVNGSHQGSRTIVNARLMEAARCGVVVLEFDGAHADKLFKPFQHYIPVANTDQAIQWARYLWKHDDRRNVIGTAAQRFAQEHYGADAYWGTVLDSI